MSLWYGSDVLHMYVHILTYIYDTVGDDLCGEASCAVSSLSLCLFPFLPPFSPSINILNCEISLHNFKCIKLLCFNFKCQFKETRCLFPAGTAYKRHSFPFGNIYNVIFKTPPPKCCLFNSSG